MQTKKCVLVGDGSVGKTSMLYTYTNNEFANQDLPTCAHESYTKCEHFVNIMVDGLSHTLGLVDTPGQEDYDRLRPLSYPQTDVLLVSFSVVDLDSFHNVKGRWMPEIRHHCPETPFLLVGTKTDRRNDIATLVKLEVKKQKPITVEKGENLAKELGAVEFVECSALTQDGLSDVFLAAIKHSVKPRKREHKTNACKCNIA